MKIIFCLEIQKVKDELCVHKCWNTLIMGSCVSLIMIRRKTSGPVAVCHEGPNLFSISCWVKFAWKKWHHPWHFPHRNCGNLLIFWLAFLSGGILGVAWAVTVVGLTSWRQWTAPAQLETIRCLHHSLPHQNSESVESQISSIPVVDRN